MDLITCLENVVGITDKECDCYTVPEVEGEPIVDPALSYSNYYIDDSEDGINLIFPANAGQCGSDNVFEITIKTRREAINDFITEFGSTLAEYTKPRHSEAISSVGEIEKNKNVPLGVAMKNYVGALLQSKRIRGSTVTIDRIRIRMNGDLVDSTLSILSSADAYVVPVVDAIEFSAPAGVLTEIVLAEPITLPLTDKHGQSIDYAIVYDRQGQEPYNYRLHCGCTSRPKPSWVRYSEIVGLNVDDFVDIDGWKKETNLSYGLIIDTRFTCKSVDWVCREWSVDWKSQAYFRVVAKVLQLLAINKTIGFVLNSQKITRYTIVSREALYGKRNHNRKQIAERFAWLAQNIPTDVVDCYSCINGRKMSVGEILV